MSLYTVLRQKLDALERSLEPVLGRFFFFFGPPMDRKAFLKAAIIVMTVHRAVSAALLYGFLHLLPQESTAASTLADNLAVAALAVFLLPFTAVVHRRLQWLGISFAGMGLTLVAVFAAAMWLIPGDPYWHPAQLAWQAGIIGLLYCRNAL